MELAADFISRHRDQVTRISTVTLQSQIISKQALER